MKQITIIIEDKLGTILSSKSLCDSSLEIIRNNDNELTLVIKSDEFLITDWRTDVLPNTPIELPADKDTAHLQWIYDRMSNVHGENENYDYMLKFKEIIEQLKKGDNNEQQ